MDRPDLFWPLKNPSKKGKGTEKSYTYRTESTMSIKFLCAKRKQRENKPEKVQIVSVEKIKKMVFVSRSVSSLCGLVFDLF